MKKIFYVLFLLAFMCCSDDDMGRPVDGGNTGTNTGTNMGGDTGGNTGGDTGGNSGGGGDTMTDDKIDFDLGISFPPVADEEQRTFTAPLLDELNVEIIRIGENWSFREPEEGNFQWPSLDARINWAETNGIDVLLTIQSNGPDWACSDLQNDKSCVFKDNEKFRNYIEQYG